MNIDLAGNKIRLIKTISSDIDKIIEFEKSNNLFVHQYPREKHL